MRASGLANPTEFFIKQAPAPPAHDPALFSPVGPAALIEPTGIEFLLPTTLTLHYDDSLVAAAQREETSVRIYRYDETAGSWEGVSVDATTVDLDQNLVSAPVSRLSVFQAGVPVAPPPEKQIRLVNQTAPDVEGYPRPLIRQPAKFISVQVLDPDGFPIDELPPVPIEPPVEGVYVSFEILEGDGFFVQQGDIGQVSNAGGVAGLWYVFGSYQGTHRILVATPDFPTAEPVEISLTAAVPNITVAGVPEGISETEVLVGSALPYAIEVAAVQTYGEFGGQQVEYGVRIEIASSAPDKVIVSPSGGYGHLDLLVVVTGKLEEEDDEDKNGYLIVTLPEFPEVEPMQIPLPKIVATKTVAGREMEREIGSVITDGQAQVGVENVVLGRPLVFNLPADLFAIADSNLQVPPGHVVKRYEYSSTLRCDPTFRAGMGYFFETQEMAQRFVRDELTLEEMEGLKDTWTKTRGIGIAWSKTLYYVPRPNGGMQSPSFMIEVRVSAVVRAIGEYPPGHEYEIARGAATLDPQYVLVAIPEMQLVEENEGGEVKPLDVIRAGMSIDPRTGETEWYEPANRFMVEMWLPVGIEDGAKAELRTLDPLGNPLGWLDGAASPVRVEAPLSLIETRDRYGLFRSGPLLAVRGGQPGLTEPPAIASGPNGEAAFQVVAGSGVQVKGAVVVFDPVVRQVLELHHGITPDWEFLPEVGINAFGGIIRVDIHGQARETARPLHVALRRRPQLSTRLRLLPVWPRFEALLNAVEDEPITIGPRNPETGCMDVTLLEGAAAGLVAERNLRVTPRAGGESRLVQKVTIVVPPQKLIQTIFAEAHAEVTAERIRTQVKPARQMTTQNDMLYEVVQNTAGQCLSPAAVALALAIRNRVEQNGAWDRFGVPANQTISYDTIIHDPQMTASGDLFDRAEEISNFDVEQGQQEAYLAIVESAGAVFAGLVNDPTRIGNAPASGILFWVSDPDILRNEVKAALETHATGDARGLITASISNEQLQAIVFENVPGFLFFRPLPAPNAAKVVNLGRITGE